MHRNVLMKLRTMYYKYITIKILLINCKIKLIFWVVNEISIQNSNKKERDSSDINIM